MREGFYWIRYTTVVQVAYLKNEQVEDMLSGKMVKGVWYLTRGCDICNNDEVEVLIGPLTPPL